MATPWSLQEWAETHCELPGPRPISCMHTFYYALVSESGKLKFVFISTILVGFVRTFEFQVFCWKMEGLEYLRKRSQGCGGELGQEGGLWRSKIGVKHFTNPGNHENRGFIPILQNQWELIYGPSVIYSSISNRPNGTVDRLGPKTLLCPRSATSA